MSIQRIIPYGYTDDYAWIPKVVPDGKEAKDIKVTWNKESEFNINGNGRTCSRCTDAHVLWNILKSYSNVKDQRNKSAHANGASGRWKYKT